MSESITLPKSGLVLKRISPLPGNDYEYEAGADGEVWIYVYSDKLAVAGVCDQVCDERAMEKAVAWLDEKCLALRSALLPPDAEDRVAKVIVEQLYVGDVMIASDWRDVRTFAKAVLAALGVDHA